MFTGLSTADLSTTAIVAILAVVVAFDTLLLLLVLVLTVRARRAGSAGGTTISAAATPLGSAAEVEARLAGRLARTTPFQAGDDVVSRGAEPSARSAVETTVVGGGGSGSAGQGAPGGTAGGLSRERAGDAGPGSLAVADLADAAGEAVDAFGEGARPSGEPSDLRAARAEVEGLLADVRRRAFEEGRETVESDAVTSPSPLAHEARDLLIDPPSGVGSGLMWEGVLASEGHRFARYGRPVTIAIMELVGIERLEAEFGPPAGEKVVRAVAQTLRGSSRASDRVARIGPARFGVLLPETDEIAAINCVERVRAACDRWLEASAVSLHLAVGWASPSPNGSLPGAVQLAAERLFQEQAPRAAGGRRRTRPAQPAT